MYHLIFKYHFTNKLRTKSQHWEICFECSTETYLPAHYINNSHIIRIKPPIILHVEVVSRNGYYLSESEKRTAMRRWERWKVPSRKETHPSPFHGKTWDHKRKNELSWIRADGMCFKVHFIEILSRLISRLI